MKKGTKAIRCELCNAIVGWVVPTGDIVHGYPVVSIKRKESYRERGGMCVHIRCVDCADGSGWVKEIKNAV